MSHGGHLRFEQVKLAYGAGSLETVVMESFDLSVSDGESVALVGPSGCGKTSVLYALCGLLRPHSGSITIDGTPVEKPRRDVALILQDAGLLPWKTVLANASLGLQLAGEATQPVRTRLKELHIEELAQRYPSELSGGQRQRVGIARALSTDPRILLMDEPLASLDAFTRERIQELFLELWLKRKHTQVLVTHNLEEAVFLGQRVVVLSSKPARILEEVHNPRVGTPHWRFSDGFYEQVLTLRKVLS